MIIPKMREDVSGNCRELKAKILDMAWRGKECNVTEAALTLEKGSLGL